MSRVGFVLPALIEGEPPDINFIVDFWNKFRTCVGVGHPSWKVLEALEREVADCLAARPQELNRAESLTAEAMVQLAGNSDL